MRKKIIAICMAALILFSASACSIEVRNADEVEAERKQAKALPVIELEKKYSDYTIDEKLEYDAAKEKAAPVQTNNGMVAPAQDKESGKWGYINSLGEWTIAPQYEYAYQFKNNLAPVLDANMKYHIIKSDGSVFASQVGHNSIDSANHFSDGFIAIDMGIGYEQSKIYMNIDGFSTIDASRVPLTSGIKYQDRRYFAVATPFVNGKAVVMSRTNVSVLEGHDNDRVLISKRGFYQSPCVIDGEGNVLATLPQGYDIADYSLDENGIIIVKDMTLDSQPYGLCDIEGNVTAECKFTRIEHSQGGLYLACDDSGFWGYIDKNGNTMIDFKFHAAYPFSCGLAAVCEDKYWGVINEAGEYVIAQDWSEFEPLYCAHQDYGAGKAAFADGVAAARRGAYWALLDANGIIIDCIYAPGAESCPYKSVSGGFVVYELYENGKATGLCGLIDLQGNPCLVIGSFTNIGLFNDEKHPA